MELSEEQKRRIEENRQKAIKLRALKAQNSINAHKLAHPITTEDCSQDKKYSEPNVTNTVSTTTSDIGVPKSSEINIAPSRTSNVNMPMASKVKATCILISHQRFQVKATFFNPLIELFKSSRTRIYDTQSKQWSFDLNEYECIKNEIQKKMGSVVEFEALPKVVLNVFSKKMRSTSASSSGEPLKVDLSNIGEKLHTSLLEFQKEGVESCIKNNGRMLIADDMGLGKTLQAIAVAAYYRDEWPLLVLTPSSVKFTWLQQLLTWLPSLSKDQIKVMLKKSEDCSACDILISSYDLVAKTSEHLLSKRFKVVIVDESHLLKNNNTQRTKNVTPLLLQAKRVIMLSGTPALSRPMELFSQLTCLDQKVFNNFHEYGVRYCAGKKCHWGWDYTGSSNLSELKIVLEEKYLIRRMKSDVLKQLPRKYRTMVVLDPSLISQDKSMKHSHSAVEKSKGMERKCLLEYFHKTAQAKLNAVCKYVLDLLESGKKFLVFAHHQVVLDSLENIVSETYEYVRIDGRTNSEQRNFFCEKFQTNDGVRIAILSIVAVNAGINLSAANLVVFAELFWNPGILVQAEDRAHRIGQMDSVNVQYLVAKNTADDFIWSMVQNKLELLGQAGISGHTFKEADTKFMAISSQKSITSFMKAAVVTDMEQSGDLSDELLMTTFDCDDATNSNFSNQSEITKTPRYLDDEDYAECNPSKRRPRL